MTLDESLDWGEQIAREEMTRRPTPLRTRGIRTGSDWFFALLFGGLILAVGFGVAALFFE